MISDTLSDAAHNIKGYMKDMPEVYGSCQCELTVLLGIMGLVQGRLDAMTKGKLLTADELCQYASRLD